MPGRVWQSVFRTRLDLFDLFLGHCSSINFALSFGMGRHITNLQCQVPYNISARCINKEWFQIPMERVWKIFEEELYICSFLHNLKVHCFVLMSNHFHLIASTPESNIDKCMHRFMGATSRRLTRQGNRINQTYAGRYFKTILSTESYYLNAYKYVYYNPVKAGLSETVEDYKFSTLHGLLGSSYLLIPTAEDNTLFSSVNDTLKWLNKKTTSQKWDAVTWGLKKEVFKSKFCRKTRKPVLAENEVI